MAIKAVIFDLGGVLLRTENGKPREALASRLGISRRELEHFVFSSPSALQAEEGKILEEQHWQILLDQLGVGLDERQVFIETFWSGDVLDNDLIDFIRGLRTNYRTGLLSNAWSGARDGIGRKFGSLDAFDVSVFSAEVGMRKPEVEIFHYILEKVGAVPDAAIFVDDFIENILAAKRIGIRCIHFHHPDQAKVEIRKWLAEDI